MVLKQIYIIYQAKLIYIYNFWTQSGVRYCQMCWLPSSFCGSADRVHWDHPTHFQL